MKYLEFTVFATTESSEAVAYILEDEGAMGVAIEDIHDFYSLNQDEKSWDYVEDGVLEALGSDVKIRGYFKWDSFDLSRDKSIRKRIKALEEFGLDIGKGEFSTREVDERDWANAWKDHFKPFKATERIIIKPSWEEYKAGNEDLVIEIDPGMAFGTGDHETTLMCLKLLEKYMEPKDLVFDVGCGSGILGIAAGRLGAKRVLCLDLDGDAVKVARDNVKINDLEEIIKVLKCNLLNGIEEKADVIIANIIADVIISFSPRAFSSLEPRGIFISSGIIKDRKKDVVLQLERQGFTIKEIMDMGEWCAIVAERN